MKLRPQWTISVHFVTKILILTFCFDNYETNSSKVSLNLLIIISKTNLEITFLC